MQVALGTLRSDPELPGPWEGTRAWLCGEGQVEQLGAHKNVPPQEHLERIKAVCSQSIKTIG